MAGVGAGEVKKKPGRGKKAVTTPITTPITPKQEAKAAIGRLVLSMQEADFQTKVGIEVTEVFKGGSLGHGTAVEHHFDIDLVLYSRSLTVESTVENGYDEYFDKIDSYLKKYLGEGYHPEDECTDVAIKFKMKLPTQSPIDVDLILSPYFSDQHELFTLLRTVDKSKRLKMFSASASKWQTQFLKHQDCWVKEYIRRAKAWRNIQWKDSNEGRPKSYLISILVIIAYDRVPAGKKVKKKGGLKKLVPIMIREFRALIREIWDNQHRLERAPSDNIYQDLLPDIPRIIDPVNPANNLYLSGIMRCKKEDNKWGPFMRKADTLGLSAKIFRRHKKIFRPGAAP